jgi:hypothetical protein
MSTTDPLDALRAAISTKYDITPVTVLGRSYRHSPLSNAPAALNRNDAREERSDPSTEGREQRNGP